MLHYDTHFQFYDKFERNQLVKAVDISQYQYPLAPSTNNPSTAVSTINGFNSYQDNGNEFIILKAGNQAMATEDAVIDPQFTVDNVNKLRDSKLKIGTYWYCYHLNININEATYPDKWTDANIISEATKEANNYANTLESIFGTGDCGEIIPCADFEDRRWASNTTKYSVQAATNTNNITITTATTTSAMAIGSYIDLKDQYGVNKAVSRQITNKQVSGSTTILTVDGAAIASIASTDKVYFWQAGTALSKTLGYVSTSTNIIKISDSSRSVRNLPIGCHIDIKTSTGATVALNRTILAKTDDPNLSYTFVTIDGAPITTATGDYVIRTNYAQDTTTGANLFLWLKTFKDVMAQRFPQLLQSTGGKGIMLYTAYYYIEECNYNADIKDSNGNGIATEIPALWLAANTSDIGSLNAGYTGSVATCGTTNPASTTINVNSTYNLALYDEVVIVDTNKNILGNGKVSSIGSTSFVYNGVKVKTDSTCSVVKSTAYPNYNMQRFGGYSKWMIWQYSSDRNRLGKQYSTNTIPIDLDVFDNNNFSMNEILCYPNTKPKLIEILEDKADKTHSHIGQYIPTNGATFDGETTITAPIAFIFKQEAQNSFKVSRNNTDASSGKANKLFLTPSVDVWVPGGATIGTIWESDTGITWDSFKSVGIGTDGFIYHNQVNTDGYVYGILPATAGWYRVAQCPTSVLTSTGTFTFRNNASGDRSCGKFIATSTYGGTTTSLIQLAYNKYTTNCITQARLVYQDQSYCYLELYHNAATETVLEIELTDNFYWIWTPFVSGTNTFANGASGVSEKLLTFSPGLVSSADIESYGQLKSTIATGTAPMVITSTTKVTNLNADKLDDLESTDFVKKDGTVSMTGPLTLSADPTTALQASTKQYVDSIAAGYKTKDSCRVATTGNITLSGTQNIDGVDVVATNRVLVWQQTQPIENGIYVVNVSTWTRATDFNESTEIVAGAYSFVTNGGTYANNGFTVTTTGTITPDTTPFYFTISTGAGTIAAGTGLTKVANTLNIANTAVTPDTYKSVTVNAQGQVTAGTNPTTLAGYGISDAADINHDHTSIGGSASTLTTARNITITGDASGTTSFDGSSDVSIAITMTGGNVYANVKAFGAVGNGITDDSSAIQAALDSLVTSGGSIIFPQGVYAVGTWLEVYSNTKITGIGNVILKRITTMNNIMHNKSNGSTGGYDANFNISIDNIKFDANGTISGAFNCTSLAFGHATNINVTNCEFYNNDGWHCLELNGVKDAVVNNCFFHDYGDPTDTTTKSHASEMLQLDLMKDSDRFPWFGPYDNTACDNIIIENCRFIGNAGTDLANSTYYSAIGNHSYVSTYTTKNIVITQNIFENLPCVISLDDIKTLNICSNVMLNCYMGIIFTHQLNTTENVVITNNRFNGLFSTASGAYGNVRFVSINSGATAPVTTTRFIISNNVITNCHHNGIAGTCNNIVVEGNNIDTCGRTGIYAYGGIGWNVSNNRVINCKQHTDGTYQEIIVGGNGPQPEPPATPDPSTPGAPIRESIISNNNATNIRSGINVFTTFITGNVCTTLVIPSGRVDVATSRANIINGTYTA